MKYEHTHYWWNNEYGEKSTRFGLFNSYFFPFFFSIFVSDQGICVPECGDENSAAIKRCTRDQQEKRDRQATLLTKSLSSDLIHLNFDRRSPRARRNLREPKSSAACFFRTEGPFNYRPKMHFIPAPVQ